MTLSPTCFSSQFTSTATTFFGSGDSTTNCDMETTMASTGQSNKVFYAIVISITVNMMHNLVWLQKTIMKLLPNIAVLKNITIFICFGLFRMIDKNITKFVNISTASPTMVFLSFYMRAMFWKIKFSILTSAISSITTIFIFRNNLSATATTNSIGGHAIKRPAFPFINWVDALEMTLNILSRPIFMTFNGLNLLPTTTSADSHVSPLLNVSIKKPKSQIYIGGVYYAHFRT